MAQFPLPPAPPRLVIIDDDPTLATVVAAIARDAYPKADDLAVDTIIGADAAVLALRRQNTDAALIVISDFHLPPSVIDGIDILGEVKKRIPAAKRVLMTGRDPEELREIVAKAQLDAFVSKPFKFEQMRALIVQLVEGVARAPAPIQ